jgi:hypothetical protein
MKTSTLKQLITVVLAALSAKAFAGTTNYSATATIFESPERGFCHRISNGESFNAWEVRNTYPGESVGKVTVRLDRFKNGASLAADPCFLTSLANSFQTARDAGVKLRVTFMYNYGDNPSGDYTACNGVTIHNDGDDASLNTILNHIAQLGPTLNQYKDVIYEIAAGFIGWFGEWHHTTHPGNDSVSAHNQVITAELNNFPGNRKITLRRPAYKLSYIGCNCPGNTPRLGHHNQKFVDDSAIFDDPQGNWSSADCRAFYSNDVSFTANGADAAPEGGTISGDTAVNRMQQYHYTIMTAYPGLISYWQTNFPGKYARMQRELGYRFQVTQATTPNTVTRGQTYTLTVKLVNNGFAKLVNRRAMYAIFWQGNSTYVTPALRDSNGSDDLRDLTLAAGVKTYTVNFTIPNTFPTGTAWTTLWLPDYAPILQSNPRFSIRLDGLTWYSSNGFNRLAQGVNNNNVQVQ